MAGRRTPRARLVGASQQRASDGLFNWLGWRKSHSPRSSLLLLCNLCHRVEPRQDRPAATLAKQTKQFAFGFPEHTYIHLHRSPSRPVDSSEETLLSLKKILEKRSEWAEQNRARLDSQLAIESSCCYYEQRETDITPLPSELREILTANAINGLLWIGRNQVRNRTLRCCRLLKTCGEESKWKLSGRLGIEKRPARQDC